MLTDTATDYSPATPSGQATPTGHAGRRIVDYDGCAAYLAGMSLSTLRAWVCEGRIPHIRVSQRIVWFDLDQVDAWLSTFAVAKKGA